MLRRVVIAAVILALGAYGIDRLVVTEEEALQALARELAAALDAEDEPGLRRVLAPGFLFDGPDPIGSGGLDDAFERALRLWDQASDIRTTFVSVEPVVQGASGIIDFVAVTRFRWGEFQVPVRSTVRLACLRVDGRWWVVEMDVTELRRGLF